MGQFSIDILTAYMNIPGKGKDLSLYLLKNPITLFLDTYYSNYLIRFVSFSLLGPMSFFNYFSPPTLLSKK
jgi:hypothetical protein